MRAVLREPEGGVRVGEVPDARIVEPTDAVVRVSLAAVCGTDLWGYRGIEEIPPGPRTGHEFLGVVADTGAEVRGLRRGDLVLAPFWWADGECAACRAGWPTSCRRGGMWGGQHDGGQAEAVRVPFADATLIPVPVTETDERLPALLTLTDVLSTGAFAVQRASVWPGATVVVLGDGAVGLCAVLVARQAGAERIILVSTHADRARLGTRFGATDVVTERGAAAVARIRDLTGGQGSDAVLNCVGVPEALPTALESVRDGGTVAVVGGPHGRLDDLSQIFLRNVTITGGLTPARRVAPQLLADVLSGALDPSPVFDLEVGLADVPAAYQAMSDRTAIKALIRI